MAAPCTPARLWVDDTRAAPEGWLRAASVAGAIVILRARQVVDLSVDYDLGEDDAGRAHPTGLHLLRWIAEHDKWPSRSLTIHSTHPAGRLAMRAFVREHSQLGPGPADWTFLASR